jgi:hypothetical protein
MKIGQIEVMMIIEQTVDIPAIRLKYKGKCGMSGKIVFDSNIIMGVFEQIP